MTFWDDLKEDPFRAYDHLSLRLGRWDFNLLKEDEKLRLVVKRVSIVLIVVWILFGFDSGVGQIEFPIIYIVGNLFLKGRTYGEGLMVFDGTITWEGVWSWSQWAYGKYMHFSAFVIYGFAFYFVSKYLAEKQDVHGSQNAIYTFCATLLSISVFEYFWMGSYYVFQHQPWILKWQYPQLRILLQNLGFLLVGLLAVVQIYTEEPYRLNVNWKAAGLLALTLGTVALWWFYPLPVQSVTVDTTTGPWTNTNHFPQTTYTVDIDPLDEVNAGVQYYLEDNVVHGVNTLVKGMMAIFFVHLFSLQRRMPR